MKLPPDYHRIGKSCNNEINTTPFNEATDGYESGSNESRFSDRFAEEIDEIKRRFRDYFAQFGEFGSQERYQLGLPSHWWIDDDFPSVSRVLLVDILHLDLTSYDVIEGARHELRQLEHRWMLLLTHNNDFDDRGEYVGEPGEYWFWVTAERVDFYSEFDDELDVFFASIPNLNQ